MLQKMSRSCYLRRYLSRETTKCVFSKARECKDIVHIQGTSDSLTFIAASGLRRKQVGNETEGIGMVKLLRATNMILRNLNCIFMVNLMTDV